MPTERPSSGVICWNWILDWPAELDTKRRMNRKLRIIILILKIYVIIINWTKVVRIQIKKIWWSTYWRKNVLKRSPLIQKSRPISEKYSELQQLTPNYVIAESWLLNNLLKIFNIKQPLYIFWIVEITRFWFYLHRDSFTGWSEWPSHGLGLWISKNLLLFSGLLICQV